MNLKKNKYLKIGDGIMPEFRGNRGKFIVYFLIRANKIVYIGRTEDIQRRICSHKSSLWVKRWFTYCRFIQCKTYDDMCKYEYRWINRFNPKYNNKQKPCASNLSKEEYDKRVSEKFYV